MTPVEVVSQFIQWRQLEYRREAPGYRHHDRSGTFEVHPLPAGHTAGDYSILATNTLTGRDRGWTEGERAVFIEGLKAIETILSGMSGFTTKERECERVGDWHDIDYPRNGAVRTLNDELAIHGKDGEGI